MAKSNGNGKKSKKQMKEFTLELIRFFKGTISGTSESVKSLTKIEEKFPEEYEEIRKSRLDPSMIDELMEKMNIEEKETFLLIFAKASYIAPKLSKLFELSLTEKKELAKTVDDYAVFVEKKLTELIDKQ